MGMQENAINGGVVEGKNKYKRMDSDEEDVVLTDFRNGQHLRQKNGVFVNNNRDTIKYVYACAFLASLNSVLLGYDVGVMSGAILFIQENLKLSEGQIEVLVGILSIVSLFGSLIGGKTSDAVGRKWTIGLATLIFQTGAAIMAFASSFRILMTGRIFAGVGIGFGIMVAPVYIVEIAPSVVRGSLTSFPEIFLNLGILLGYISNYVFSGLPVHINWRVMLGVGILPSILMCCALFVIPESPRWLVMQNRIDEARLVLSKTNETETEVEERLAEIQQAAGFANAEKYEAKAVWREILSPTPPVRRMLIAGAGIQCFQQITGIDATVHYSPTVFKDAGMKGNNQVLAATVAVGFTKTMFILIAISLIDRVGRKPLLYVSTIGMTVSLLFLSFTLAFLGNGNFGIALAVLSICGNVAFFSIGIGPICWVLSSEIFPLRLRAQASALGAVGSRLSSGVVTMSFLTVSRTITVGGTFFIFSLISALSVAFVYACVPETKGKSLEQIEMIFQNEGELPRGEMEMGDVARLVPKE